MKIVKTDIEIVAMTLSEPYVIAYETVSAVANVFLIVETDAGITGVGCAAPAPLVTGETADTVATLYRQVIEPVLHGSDPLGRAALRHRLTSEIPAAPAALAMADMALMDILGKRAGLPVHRILGGYRERIPTSVTIGILAETEAVQRALHFKRLGFKSLKLKGGCDVAADIARTAKIREAVGDDMEIRFDANGGYTEEEALRFAAASAASAISVIEEPVTRGDPQLLARIRQASPTPIMADESLMNVHDAIALARSGAADMINVKLMKVGGITAAMQVIVLAAALNVEVMVGCMDEAAVSIAAGLHVALSHPSVRYADLDGHLDLKGDPSQRAVILNDGYLYPSPQPGLGWTP